MELETTLDVDPVAMESVGEVDVLLDVAAPGGTDAVSLMIRPADSVPAFTVWNDLPVRGVDDGVMVHLGDLRAGEQRRILLGFEVPDTVDATSICELELRWVDRSSMTDKVVTVPVNASGAEFSRQVTAPAMPPASAGSSATSAAPGSSPRRASR
jgi:hypothetical protein